MAFFNIGGAITGAIAGLRFGPYGALAGAFIGGIVLPALITPVATRPKLDKADRQSGKQYNVDLQQNQAALNDIRPVGIGTWRDWYTLRAPTYKEYENHNEILHAYLHVTEGFCTLNKLQLDQAPLSAFQGSSYQFLDPGEAMTLIHPNVYTNEAVDSIELIGGTQGTLTLVTKAWFEAARSRVYSPNYGLNPVSAGSSITISGSLSNDGVYTVTDKGFGGATPRDRSTWLELSGGAIIDEPIPAFVDGVRQYVTITVEYAQTVDPEDADTIKTPEFDESGDAIHITFDDVLNEIRAGPPIADFEGLFADFRPGDVVGVFNAGNPAVEGIEFTILDTDFSTHLVVTPSPPSTVITTAQLYLIIRRSGPYFAAPPGELAERIGVDVFFDALGVVDGGDVIEKTVSMELQYRPVNDAGSALDTWTTVTFGFADAKLSPRRFSFYVDLDPPIRPQVNLRKLSLDNSSITEYDDAKWAGLRGYLATKPGSTPDVDATATTLAVKVRASGLLSFTSQRKINGEQIKWWPVYNGSTWINQATNNPAWNAIGWLVSQSEGQITYDHFDLPAWLSFAAGCDMRGDTAGGLIANERQLWPTAQAIMRTARAKIVLDSQTGKYVPLRDEDTAPSLMFCDGFNSTFSASAIKLLSEDSQTGVRVKFTDPVLWQERDGPLVGTGARLDEVQFEFCTSWGAAWREANFIRDDARYRVHTGSLDAEMDGTFSQLAARVLLCSVVKGWGQSAAVVEYDDTVPMIRVSPAPTWTESATHYVYLQGPEGEVSAQIGVTMGETEDELVLAAPAPFAIRDGSSEWETLVAFGHDGVGDVRPNRPRKAIITGGSPGDARHVTLNFTLDDARVYADPGTAPDDPYTLDLENNLEVENLTAVWLSFVPLPGDLFRATALVGWTPNPNAASYELSTRFPATQPNWFVYSRGISTAATFSIDLPNPPPPPELLVRVIAYSDSGDIGPASIEQVT